MLFEQCPAAYRSRYVDGEAFELTEAVAFGQAVHQGLESHFNGQDGEYAFRTAWKQYSLELGAVHSGLTGTGLELIDKVIALDLHGTSERGFSLDTEAELGAPIVGAVDLWGDDTIYDFKTTRGLWSQTRAEHEIWQPAIYTWAYWEETGRWPQFEYIVLNRCTGQLDRFRRQWTADECLALMDAAWLRMRHIAAAVAAGELECRGSHGWCPECGERWSHPHVCDSAVRGRRIRL